MLDLTAGNLVKGLPRSSEPTLVPLEGHVVARARSGDQVGEMCCVVLLRRFSKASEQSLRFVGEGDGMGHRYLPRR